MLSSSILYCNKLDENILMPEDDMTYAVTRRTNMSTPSSLHSSPPPSLPPPISRLRLVDVSASPSSVNSKRPPSTSSSSSRPKTRYRVQYLGSHTCDQRSHRIEGGLAAYQKPLLDLYTTVVRRSVVLRTISVISQVAEFSEHGIVVAQANRARLSSSSPSSPDGGETVVTKVITPLSNILLWAAVKFQHRTVVPANKVKYSLTAAAASRRKQLRAAFVPLSCSEGVLDKSAFVSLTAKQRFLLGLPHPPLFACVLQKVNAADRLECHLFVACSADDAIGMCRQIGQLRKGQTSVGRLRVPSEMGTYSYEASLAGGGGAGSSVLSPSRASNYYASSCSEHQSPSITYQHYFSDIEEEEPANDAHSHQPNRTALSTTSRALSSSASTPVHSRILITQPKRFLASPQEFFARQLSENSRHRLHSRLYDRRRRINSTPKVNTAADAAANHRTNHQLAAGHDTHSMTELCSLSSSAVISTKSEPKPGNAARRQQQHRQLAQLARRDYRFQGFKEANDVGGGGGGGDGNTNAHPQHFQSVATSPPPPPSSMLSSRCHEAPTKTDNRSSSIPVPTSEIKVLLSSVVNNNNNNKPNINKTTPTTARTMENELQHNPLFAKASAAAIIHRSERSPPGRPRAPSSDSSSNKSSSEQKSPSQRFFGDSLRGLQQLHLVPFKGNNAAAPRAEGAAAKETRAMGRSSPKIQRAVVEKHRTTRTEPKQESIITSSLFFDSEDKSASDYRLTRSNSEDTMIYHNPKTSPLKNIDKYSPPPPAPNVNISKTKSVPNLDDKSHDSPVVLYLPENNSSALGVKGFNKRTSVAQWSTLAGMNKLQPVATTQHPPMRPSSFPSAGDLDCELCNSLASANCTECAQCCQCCQSIEPPPNCPECQHNLPRLNPPGAMPGGDILMNRSARPSDRPTRQMLPSIEHDDKLRSLDTIDSHSSFFSRIKRLTLRSLFSNRKGKETHRNRNLTRTGSQRLKGSRPFSLRQKLLMPKHEAASRIFLPEPAAGPKGHCYGEPFLKTESIIKLDELTGQMRGVHLHAPSYDHRPGRSSPPGVQPFFISHPRSNGHTRNVEARVSELGHILSLSSDSGMEECDCHSSTENSPTGFITSAAVAETRDYDIDRIRSRLHSSRDYLDVPYAGHRNVCTNNMNYNGSKDTRRQARDWSNTNLQQELGYIP